MLITRYLPEVVDIFRCCRLTNSLIRMVCIIIWWRQRNTMAKNVQTDIFGLFLAFAGSLTDIDDNWVVIRVRDNYCFFRIWTLEWTVYYPIGNFWKFGRGQCWRLNCGKSQPGSYDFRGGVATIVFAVGGRKGGGVYFCTLKFYYIFITKCFSILTKFVICLKKM